MEISTTHPDGSQIEESGSGKFITKTPRLSEESRGSNSYQDAAITEESRSRVYDQDAAT